MRIIGITGASGAGKSAVCFELKKRGAEIVDADEISRQVSARGGAAFDELVDAFGAEILKSDGEIDRRRLGHIVFNDAAKLQLLNKITHKHIFAEMKKRIDKCMADVVVLDVPLLFQADFPFKCDLTVAVTASAEVRMNRIIKRDGIGAEAAAERMKNQMTDEEYAKKADIVIENNGELGDLKRLADRVIGEK